MKIETLFRTVPDHPVRPYIIAEAGVNHEADMDTARRLIDEAKEGGAHAIKFQTYKASTLASRYSPAYWDTTKETTQSQFELFSKYDKFWKDEFETLKTYCDAREIEFLSTPFDRESADFLNDLMPVFKISSSDLTNTPFTTYLCRFNKPILLSTGASNPDEIDEAVRLIRKHGNPLSLLHCILNYPTPDENAHLGMTLDLKRRYPDIPIGYSDHTLPKDMRTLETAVLLGAVVLEKHFTHDKTLPGNDHYHAMDKEDLKVFHQHMDRLFTLLGSFEKRALEAEEPARQNARRSLVASRPIPANQPVTEEDVLWKRPGTGISPRFLNDLIGKKPVRDIAEDEILDWSLFQ